MPHPDHRLQQRHDLPRRRRNPWSKGIHDHHPQAREHRNPPDHPRIRRHPQADLWDCRSDTANLFHEYGVKLAGIKDVQLIHTRRKTCENLSYRSGLDLAIRDAGFGPGGWGKWQTNKHAGQSACQDPRGCGVFADRPLSTVLKEYAAGDSRYLIQLYNKYLSQLSEVHKRDVEQKTFQAIEASCSPNFNGGSK